MDKYLKSTIVNGRSNLRKNSKDVFCMIRDTFQEEEINAFKTFKRANIKNNKDLIIAYHEKKILDSQEEYIAMLCDMFKDTKIKRVEISVDDFYD